MPKTSYSLQNGKLKLIPRFSEYIEGLTGLEELIQLTNNSSSVGSEKIRKLVRQELKKRNLNEKNQSM